MMVVFTRKCHFYYREISIVTTIDGIYSGEASIEHPRSIRMRKWLNVCVCLQTSRPTKTVIERCHQQFGKRERERERDTIDRSFHSSVVNF